MVGTPYECIAYLEECDLQKQYEVKEVKRRRSLTQNAYYWAMLNKLARKLRISDTELHKNMLREYGQCEIFSLSNCVPLDDYFTYYDIIGIEYIDGDVRNTVKVYKGSSRMNSSEFTHLIEGMRFECEQQGIQVMTPEEISRLRFVEPDKE